MPARILAGAMCVQRFDDSLNSAIHITYRILLRSSSMPEPRDPLLKVLIYLWFYSEVTYRNRVLGVLWRAVPFYRERADPPRQQVVCSQGFGSCKLGNDPSAGSPTETLLRLLLPLNDRVWRAFRP